MHKVCIAADIGASSGRLIAGWIDGDRLHIREIHRFQNRMDERGGHFYWDAERLYNEILTGLSKAETPFASIGVDTWGVDYALLDEHGQLIGDIYAYRDHRTDGIMEKVDKPFVYSRTGMQFVQFNTLFQLMAHSPKKAAHILLMPDYLHYKLCGRISSEYTIASTSQLININTGDWDDDMIALTGFSKSIFPEIVPPGTVLGTMKDNPEVKVIAPASHDTASAVAAVPAATDSFAYISSGTWSLMGIESMKPRLENKSFSNEGGVFGTYRVLKNIMGLWMIQELNRELNCGYSFEELMRLAETPFGSYVDANSQRFLNPASMKNEIQAACRESGQRVPVEAGELARCVYDSLVVTYKDTLKELREFKEIDRLHIVGGGSNAKLLNRLTAKSCGCTVYAGPVEATSIGNIIMQLIALGEIKDHQEGRRLVANSFEFEEVKAE